jgi:hypothetical protein
VSTELVEETKTSTGDGDHDRFAHYVKREDAMRAYVTGEPIVALCGKVWTPSRDPEKYPVCPTCRELLTVLSD